jgi:hypothetical protein
MIGQRERALNTDDRTLVEFGFARGLGETNRFDVDELFAVAHARGEDRPAIARGSVAWELVAANRATIPYVRSLPFGSTDEEKSRHRAALLYADGHLAEALAEWRSHPWTPVNSAELTMIAECLADAGSDDAAVYAEQLRRWEPADADFVLGRMRYRQNRPSEATAALRKAFLTMRTDPWETPDTMGRSLDLARNLNGVRAFAPLLIGSLSRPFAAGQWEDARRWYLALMLRDFETCTPRTIRALRALEPWPPWQKEFLTVRRDCYATVMLHDLARRAERDLAAFTAAERMPLMK